MALIKPMLAEEIPQSRIPEFCADDRYAFDQKLNGHRRMVHLHERIIPLAKLGTVTTLPPRVVTALSPLLGEAISFDAELVGTVLWVFDMPAMGTCLTPEDPFQLRRRILEQLFERLDLGPSVRLAPCAWTPEEKATLTCRLLRANCEGVMIKDRTGPYLSGRRTHYTLKAKFTQPLRVVVMELKRKGKDSLRVGLYDGDELVDVGAVTVNNPSLRSAKVGDVIEVTYNYASAVRRLVEPAGGRVVDADPLLCRIGNLKIGNRAVIPTIN